MATGRTGDAPGQGHRRGRLGQEADGFQETFRMKLTYMSRGQKCEGEIVGAVGMHLRVNRRKPDGKVCEELVALSQADDKQTFRQAWSALSSFPGGLQTEDGPLAAEDLLC